MSTEVLYSSNRNCKKSVLIGTGGVLRSGSVGKNFNIVWLSRMPMTSRERDHPLPVMIDLATLDDLVELSNGVAQLMK